MKIKNYLYIATLITLAIGSLSGCFYCMPLLIGSLLSAVVFSGLNYWTPKERSLKYFDGHCFPGGC